MDCSHIAFVISGLGAGGAERVVAMLARHWIERGLRVTIISFDAVDDPIFHPFPAEATILRLGVAAEKRTGSLKRLARLRRALKQVRPDAVVSLLTKNNLLALLATPGSGIRTVCCERNNPERQPKHPLWARMLNLLYRRADAIVCQTEGVTRCIPESARHLVRIIPNPVETAPPVPLNREGGRLVAVGRLDPQKGFDLLIEAFAAAADDFPRWRLDIWGEGRGHDELEAMIAGKGLRERIALRGISATPRGWIDGADLFVLPSRFEGFPNVLAEAMAAGLASIAADCDFGPADMIEDGVSGVLFETEDAAALEDALRSLMQSAELREIYAAKGRAAMQRFAPGPVMRQWDDMIDSLLPAKSSGHSPVAAGAGAGATQ